MAARIPPTMTVVTQRGPNVVATGPDIEYEVEDPRAELTIGEETLTFIMKRGQTNGVDNAIWLAEFVEQWKRRKRFPLPRELPTTVKIEEVEDSEPHAMRPPENVSVPRNRNHWPLFIAHVLSGGAINGVAGAAIAALIGEIPAVGGFLVGGTMLPVIILTDKVLLHCGLSGTRIKHYSRFVLALLAGVAASLGVAMLAEYAITLATYGAISVFTLLVKTRMDRMHHRQVAQARIQALAAHPAVVES